MTNNKEVKVRNYEDEKDLQLQYDFWKRVTANLPWALKHTKSPSIFHQQE